MYAVEHPLPKVSNDDEQLEVDYALASNAEELQECKRRVEISLYTRGRTHWRSRTQAEWVPSKLLLDAPRKRPATRAYFKMWEMARACALPTPSAILLLCEAPGGFVQACCDLYPDASWKATSLVGGGIVFHPSIEESHLIPVVHNGDLRLSEEQDAIARACEGGVDLVTADGGADVDHERLEEEMHALSVACVDVAFRVLRPGGTLVLKLFECCRRETIELVHRVSAAFAQVSLMKPNSSRATNSERYLIAVGFRGKVDSLAPPTRSWWQGVRGVVEYLNDMQIKALESRLVK